MKKPSKDRIRRIKEQEKAQERMNVTFRLKKTLISEFKEKCEKEGITMTAILEDMIADFLNP